MAHQPLLVTNTKSIFIHINISISNNSVSYKYSFFCLHTVTCQNSCISQWMFWEILFVELWYLWSSRDIWLASWNSAVSSRFRRVLDVSQYSCMWCGKMGCNSLYDFMVHLGIIFSTMHFFLERHSCSCESELQYIINKTNRSANEFESGTLGFYFLL